MALSNFLLTVMGVGAVYLLLRGDVKDSARVFQRNMRHIRNWLEEESKNVPKNGPAKPKEIESQAPERSIPKEEK